MIHLPTRHTSPTSSSERAAADRGKANGVKRSGGECFGYESTAVTKAVAGLALQGVVVQRALSDVFSTPGHDDEPRALTLNAIDVFASSSEEDAVKARVLIRRGWD